MSDRRIDPDAAPPRRATVSADDAPGDPARRLEWMTALALGLIACLSLSTYLLFHDAIGNTLTDAPVISVAGRQRMLVQKLTNLALEIQVAAERGQFAFLAGELRNDFEAWSLAHEGLQHGEPTLDLPPNTNPQIADEFATIAGDYQAIRDAVEDLMDELHQPSVQEAYGNISSDVFAVLSHKDPFADGMDRIAALLLAQAQEHVVRVENVVLGVTGITLLLLLVEGLLVFRPAAALIRRQFREQHALAAEARKLALVASHTDNAVLIADNEGRPGWMNDAFVRMHGSAPDGLKGILAQTPLERTSLASPRLDTIEADLRAGRAVRTEIAHAGADGAQRWGDLEVVPVLGDDGQVVHLIAIERDVTAHVRAAEEIRRHTAEVETSRDQLRTQAEALEALTKDLAAARDAALESTRAKAEFLANMSHEIRTPMNGVIGMTQLLLETVLTEEQRDHALMVLHSADALLTVINDILDFSKIEAGKLTLETVDFDLRTVLEEVSELLAPRVFAKGLAFACVVAPQAHTAFRCDPVRLRQVVMNLLGNAVKFTETGEIVVAAAVSGETATHATVRIAVRDTGIGIPKERQAAVFESFTQADGGTSRRYGGTGLGLTISRQLVNLMGGRLGLESEPGRGSTFWMELPLEKATAAATAALLPPELAGRRVLVVDDHETTRTGLAAQLRAWGLHVVEARGGAAALAALRVAGTSAPFDVVALDEPTAAAIQDSPEIGSVPVLLLSSAGVRPAAQTQQAGCAAVLSKPVRRARLLRALAQALGVSEGGPRGRPEEAPPAPAVRLGLRVLLAEDNVINQKVAQRMLERWGCRVDVVGDGAQAVAAWERTPYDVILMDMQMPVMDGYEATVEVRRREAGRGGHTPIVALTAEAMEGDDQRCRDAGMDDYVAKPVDAARLLAALGRSTGGAPTAAPAPAVAADVVLDADRLAAACGPGLVFLGEIVREFLDVAPRLLAQIETSLARDDPGELVRASQALKGSSRTLGADGLGSVCAELEQLGDEQALDGARDALARARAEFTRLRAVLEAYVAPPLAASA